MWKKQSNIFCGNGQHDWMQSHASNPTPVILSDKIVRIYFSCRDLENQSHIGFVDVDFSDDYNIINISDQPVVSPGVEGAFDHRGCSIGCIIKTEEVERLYYLGWNLGVDVPFRNSIGLVERKNSGEAFKRLSQGPMVDRNMIDPFSVSYPFILIEDGIWKMWYGSHKKWGKTTSDMIHALKYAESKDGINWNLTNIICIDTDETDYAFSRPCVIKEDGLYKMWYSYRGGKYRIGYAESEDGIKWHRKDNEVGITVSADGWDSEMVCYPYVFDFQNQRYMLYNGNAYGNTGFGIAIL